MIILILQRINSLQYSTIVDAIKMCHEVGKGVLLAKVDLPSDYVP